MTDERTIVSDLKSCIDKLDGFQASVEEHPTKGRADLIVRYKGRILFNGEFKKPYVVEGYNPKAYKLVLDAFTKSQSLAPVTSNFFVTSNLNETVIWDNRDATKPFTSRDVFTIPLDHQIRNDDSFSKPECVQALKKLAHDLCRKVLDLSKSKSQYKPLGESFIQGLNSHLDSAVNTAISRVPMGILADWWKEQNYEPVKEFGDDEKKRLARYSFYVLANKVVFYYVLKRSFPLDGIAIPEEVNNIKNIKVILDAAFQNAIEVSGDFDVVFIETKADKIPFLHDDLIFPLTSLINFIIVYDFSTLTQDILGNLYDRLIDPKERHDNGQYFTPIPVVDLINALTIKSSDARVLDPACGSGTFLTRAFDLKMKLSGGRDDTKKIHEKFIEELYGVDIAAYPAHLATIVLSSKLLYPNPKIYPKIVHEDFLKVKPDEMQPKYRLSKSGLKAKKLDGSSEKVMIKPIDAVVSNLPYIRQENINDKDATQKAVKYALEEAGYAPSAPDNRSDFHAYFWYYILPFIKEGSRVGFLVSDTWMNVDYGDTLKKFVNKYFKIIAVIDSSVERWFEDAEVNTVIVILERTKHRESKNNNPVRFVRINKPIVELVPDVDAAINLANQIESGSCKHARITTVRQADLQLDSNDKLKTKLYPYLRGTKEFFELVNKDMVPLNNIAEVKFGIKTGANDFFYVEDVTEDYDAQTLYKTFGIRRGERKKLSIIEDGTGQRHILEKEYLQPIIKGPKEFTSDGKLVFDKPSKKMVVLIVEENKSKIKTYGLKYIKHGETYPPGEHYSERESCNSRTYWWKLSPIIYPEIILTMYYDRTFMYSRPTTQILLDHQLYFGNMKDAYKNDSLSLYAFLNSSLSYMYPDLYGRNYGGGAVGLMVYETNLLPIPKPENLRKYYPQIRTTIDHMEKRRIGSVFDEIWDTKSPFTLHNVKPDRLQLDKIILKALAFKTPEKFLESWYPSVVKLVIERLNRAASIKSKKKSKKVSSLQKIADEIIDHLHLKDFPEEYVGTSVQVMTLNQGKVNFGRDLDGFFVQIESTKYYVNNLKEQKYLFYSAFRRKTKVPMPQNIAEVLAEFEEDLRTWRRRTSEEIDSITSDPQTAEKLKILCSEKAKYPL